MKYVVFIGLFLISFKTFSQYRIERNDEFVIKCIVVDSIGEIPVYVISCKTIMQLTPNVTIYRIPEKMPDCYFKICNNDSCDHVSISGQIKNNKLYGNITHYFENNQVESIINYGLDRSINFHFYQNGKIKAVYYGNKDNEIIDSECWSPEGKKISFEDLMEIYWDVY